MTRHMLVAVCVFVLTPGSTLSKEPEFAAYTLAAPAGKRQYATG
jgi:hypothetical protein